MAIVLEQETGGILSLCDDAMQVIHDRAHCAIVVQTRQCPCGWYLPVILCGLVQKMTTLGVMGQ